MLTGKELLNPEWAERLLSWRHSGFNVHSLVRTGTKAEAERVGKYMIRPLVSLERLAFLETEGQVVYRLGRAGEGLETMDYLEFIARVTSHIPDKGQVSLEGEPATRFPLPTVASLPASLSRALPCDQGGIPPWIPRPLWQGQAVMVRYYGLYSSAYRGKSKKNSDPALRMIMEKFRTVPSKSWTALIRKVYEFDPLVCSRCGGRMKVVAFLTANVVVDRIIDHLKSTFVAEKPPP